VYLASYQVGLAAVCEARCKLPILQRPALQQIPVIAGELNAWAGTDEPVKVNLVKKDQEGNTRTVLDFGIENRSLQHMILALVKARGDLHPLQFGTKGVPHAIDKVVELMKDGCLWTIETDLANCFPSFEGENLHRFQVRTLRLEVVATIPYMIHPPGAPPGQAILVIALGFSADAKPRRLYAQKGYCD